MNFQLLLLLFLHGFLVAFFYRHNYLLVLVGDWFYVKPKVALVPYANGVVLIYNLCISFHLL